MERCIALARDLRPSSISDWREARRSAAQNMRRGLIILINNSAVSKDRRGMWLPCPLYLGQCGSVFVHRSGERSKYFLCCVLQCGNKLSGGGGGAVQCAALCVSPLSPHRDAANSGDDVAGAGELSCASLPLTYEFLLDFAVIISSPVTVQHTRHYNRELTVSAGVSLALPEEAVLRPRVRPRPRPRAELGDVRPRVLGHVAAVEGARHCTRRG